MRAVRLDDAATSVGNETALRALLQPGRVAGICSESPRSGWGTVLGPKLVEANGGRPLSSAWTIEEQREPPSAELVALLLAASIGCFAAVLVSALVIFWKAP